MAILIGTPFLCWLSYLCDQMQKNPELVIVSRDEFSSWEGVFDEIFLTEFAGIEVRADVWAPAGYRYAMFFGSGIIWFSPHTKQNMTFNVDENLAFMAAPTVPVAMPSKEWKKLTDERQQAGNQSQESKQAKSPGDDASEPVDIDWFALNREFLG
jgi:hypothetical protein